MQVIYQKNKESIKFLKDFIDIKSQFDDLDLNLASQKSENICVEVKKLVATSSLIIVLYLL